MMKRGEKKIERELPSKELRRSLVEMMTREMRIGEIEKTGRASGTTGAMTAEGAAELRGIGGRKGTGMTGRLLI